MSTEAITANRPKQDMLSAEVRSIGGATIHKRVDLPHARDRLEPDLRQPPEHRVTLFEGPQLGMNLEDERPEMARQDLGLTLHQLGLHAFDIANQRRPAPPWLIQQAAQRDGRHLEFRAAAGADLAGEKVVVHPERDRRAA